MAKRSGVEWQSLDPEMLPPAQQKLFSKYRASIEDAKEIANKLKTSLETEWRAQHPDALSEARFNIINGTVLVMMTEARTPPKKRFNPFE